jgi:putative Holliday junction resolvase
MGLAIGDDATGLASPLEVVACDGTTHAARLIADSAIKLDVACVVVGLPVREDGSRAPACRRSEALASELAALGLEVVLQSEFLTTNEARRRARSAGRPKNRPVDDIAAQILLEEFLATQTETPAAES